MPLHRHQHQLVMLSLQTQLLPRRALLLLLLGHRLRRLWSRLLERQVLPVEVPYPLQ